MRPADLPLDRQHRAGPVLLWDAFAVLTEVTVLYRRTGRRRRRLWTWGEHLPPPSVVRNSNMEGQLWVQRRRSWLKLKTEGEVRLCSGRDLVSKETSRRVGIERCQSRNARILACVGNRSSSSKGSACCDLAWLPPRVDDPDRSKQLHDYRFAFSISTLHPVAARLVVGPDDVRDVGEGNERYDAVRPSGSRVGSEINNGHCNSSLCSSWPKNVVLVRHRGREAARSQGRAHPLASRANLCVGGVPEPPFHAKVVTLNL